MTVFVKPFFWLRNLWRVRGTGGSEGIRTLVPLRAVTAFRVRAVMTTSIRFHIMYVNIKFVAEAYRSGRRSLRSAEDHLLASLSLLLSLRKRIEVVGVRFARLRTTYLLLFPFFFRCGSVSKWHKKQTPPLRWPSQKRCNTHLLYVTTNRFKSQSF